MITIHDGNYQDFIEPIYPNETGTHGLRPRDFARDPHGSLAYAKPFALPLIPRSEWAPRIAARKAAKAQLSDVRMTGNAGQMIPSRDQDGKGYCWAHSGVSAHLVCRALMNEPYADLSAFAVACMVKNFLDEGGWGGEGVDFESKKGVPTSEFWPQQSMSRANDNPATWANAALHKYIEWYDLDPNSMLDQMVTALLYDMPVVSDFNWWGHSVCTIDAVEWDGGTLTSLIWNSWGDSWSDHGMGQLKGSKAIPDSALAARIVSPSLK